MPDPLSKGSRNLRLTINDGERVVGPLATLPIILLAAPALALVVVACAVVLVACATALPAFAVAWVLSRRAES